MEWHLPSFSMGRNGRFMRNRETPVSREIRVEAKLYGWLHLGTQGRMDLKDQWLGV